MTTCMLTGATLRWGAPCVLLPLAPAFRDGTRRDHAGFPAGARLITNAGACTLFEPVLLPLFGRVGEFGGLDAVEDDAHMRFLAERVGMAPGSVANAVTEGYDLPRLTRIARRLYREVPAPVPYRRALRWSGQLYGTFVARSVWETFSSRLWMEDGRRDTETLRDLRRDVASMAGTYAEALRQRRSDRERLAAEPQGAWSLVASSLDAATVAAFVEHGRARIHRLLARRKGDATPDAPETPFAIEPHEVEQTFTDRDRRYVVTLRATLRTDGTYRDATAWTVEQRTVTEPRLEGVWQPEIAFPAAAWEALAGQGYRARVPYALHLGHRMRDCLAPEMPHLYGRRLFTEFADALLALRVFEVNTFRAGRMLAPSVYGPSGGHPATQRQVAAMVPSLVAKRDNRRHGASRGRMISLDTLSGRDVQALAQSDDAATRDAAEAELRRRIALHGPEHVEREALAKTLGLSPRSLDRFLARWPDLPVGWPRGRGAAGVASANRARSERRVRGETTMSTPIPVSAADARDALLAQWAALRAENQKDRARVFDEATATTAIDAALAVARTLGDREVEGYIAYGVPGSYMGAAWSDAVEIAHAGGEVVLRVIRRDSVRNAGRGGPLHLVIRAKGKGARAVTENAREAFAEVVAD